MCHIYILEEAVFHILNEFSLNSEVTVNVRRIFGELRQDEKLFSSVP